MGIKSLTLQMIPWCFPVVGATRWAVDDVKANTTSQAQAVRLIALDGRVKLYNRPVKVAEPMIEFPLHLICRSDSFFVGQKVPALSASDRLEPGHSYFLLPSHFFHSVLSFVTLASSLSNPNPNPNPAKRRVNPRPFDIQKTAAGTLQIRVSDEFIERIREEEEEEEMKRGSRRVLCTTEELEKDYSNLVRKAANSWKPRLETIREAVSWRRGSFGGTKRRKKKPLLY